MPKETSEDYAVEQTPPKPPRFAKLKSAVNRLLSWRQSATQLPTETEERSVSPALSSLTSDEVIEERRPTPRHVVSPKYPPVKVDELAKSLAQLNKAREQYKATYLTLINLNTQYDQQRSYFSLSYLSSFWNGDRKPTIFFMRAVVKTLPFYDDERFDNPKTPDSCAQLERELFLANRVLLGLAVYHHSLISVEEYSGADYSTDPKSSTLYKLLDVLVKELSLEDIVVSINAFRRHLWSKEIEKSLRMAIATSQYDFNLTKYIESLKSEDNEVISQIVLRSFPQQPVTETPRP